ncbi:glycosyltransferase family 2 protein [Bacteroides clarus]|uniref:glycosyltransferase family 2 protein n=1 Tax=Bacteroides clarus TaxID=626929 RepID=UPI003FEDADA1
MVQLSIIIPIYNTASSINRCLDSIFNQTTTYLYEVIIVDDGSTDNSIEIIKSRKETNIILYQQKNAGPAVARNKGVELAQGEYCAYLDADDYWKEGFIEETVTFLENHPECIAVSVAQHHITISGSSIVPTCYMQYTEPFVLNDFFTFWAKYMHVCTGSTTIRTEILHKTGGQRTDLRITEDLEFWALISTYGNWGVIPKILFVSNGNEITYQQGWLNKMTIRWNNAPSITEWEKRIILRLPKLTKSYKKARGKISRNLTYCQILSGRLSLSRSEAMKYGHYFNKDYIGILMNIAKYSSFTWYLLTIILKYREYHRK